MTSALTSHGSYIFSYFGHLQHHEIIVGRMVIVDIRSIYALNGLPLSDCRLSAKGHQRNCPCDWSTIKSSQYTIGWPPFVG